MKHLPSIMAAILCLIATNLQAKTYTNHTLSDDAMRTLQSVITMMDEGNNDTAIDMLQELLRMYPDDYTLSYELALAYYWNQQPEQAIEVLQPMIDVAQPTAEVYGMLGNCYDALKQLPEAIATYDKGITQHPHFGKLYAEKGIAYLANDSIYQALDAFKSGIANDPNYDANYYRAAWILANSNQAIQALAYAETHMLLSNRIDRNNELAQLIKAIYENRIQFNGDTTQINLSQAIFDSKPDSSTRMTIEQLYEISMLLSLAAKQNNWTLTSMADARGQTLDILRESGCINDSQYLFKFQDAVKKAGHWEAYNVYILGAAFPDETEKWFEEKNNEKKFENFADWFNNAPFNLSDTRSAITPTRKLILYLK